MRYLSASLPICLNTEPMKNKHKLSSLRVAVPLACFCCLLWASAFPAIKTGYSLFSIESGQWASQILFGGIRFTVAGVLVLIFGSIIAKKPLRPAKASNIKYIFILSLAQTSVHYIFFYIGLANTQAAKSSVLNSVSVFLSVILAAVFFKNDKLTPFKIIGCVMGFSGIVLMNFGSLGFGFKFLGEGFIILSAISGAISSVLIKKFTQFEQPVVLSGYQFFLGGIIMALAGFTGGGKLSTVNAKGALIILYLAFLSAAAYTIWGILLKYNDVSSIAVFGFVTPIGGVIMSSLILGEELDVIKCGAALLLVSAGIVLVNLKLQKKNKLTN